MKTALLVLIALAIIALGVRQCAQGSRGGAGGTAMDGKPAPAWALRDLDGRVVKSTDLAGKVVVVDFWATWCPPCRAEIPGYVALQKMYADRGVVVVGISVDEGGAGVVRDFAKANAINYPIVLADEKIADAFGGIRGIPTTFIVGRDGKIVFSKVGGWPEAAFEEQLKRAL